MTEQQCLLGVEERVAARRWLGCLGPRSEETGHPPHALRCPSYQVGDGEQGIHRTARSGLPGQQRGQCDALQHLIPSRGVYSGQ